MHHNVKKSYINSQFGQVHFQIYGEGIPLILCHQSPSSLEMFNSVYPVLASLGIQSIGIDTPGYGQSDGPNSQPKILDYAQCVVDVITSTGYDKVSLLGHHTGACIVAEIASLRPELINKIILNGPPLLTQDEKQKMLQMIEKAPSLTLKKDGSHLLKLWNKRIKFTPGWTNLDAMHNGIIQMLCADNNDIFGFKAAFDQDLESVLMRIEHPTMILTNTGDDIYFAALRAKELRPDFIFKELQNGTHDIVDEQPTQWSKCIADFLK